MGAWGIRQNSYAISGSGTTLSLLSLSPLYLSVFLFLLLGPLFLICSTR